MKVDLGGNAEGPLAGIRVLDFSNVISGPLCSQILGDLGADVIKLETTRGDTSRMMGPPFQGGFTSFFSQYNRNKRSVVLDLKQPDAVEVARKLAARADVVIENFRPGVTDRMGLGYEALRADNPGLVYVSINGFGSDGPYRDHPAYDSVIQGLSGFMQVQGDDGDPTLVRCVAADKTSGMTATYALIAALFERERNGGRGQKVEIPMLDAFAAFILPDVFGADTFEPRPDSPAAIKPAELHRTWRTSDGHIVMMIIEDHQFQAMCRALEREDLIEDERCANIITRITHIRELFEIIEEEVAKWKTEEIVERARRFGAPVAPVNGLAEFQADPQVLANGTIVESDDPDVGRFRFLGNPVRFERTPTSLRRHPPHLGRHSDEVLGELGYSEQEIAALREKAALA